MSLHASTWPSDLYQSESPTQVATSQEYHALLWTGTAASYQDLNPSGFLQSAAAATNGTQQTGYGYTTVGDVQHALLWSGTAASAIDFRVLTKLPSTAMSFCVRWD